MSEPRAPRRLLLFVFVTAALSSIGFGIILPVMPELLAEVTGDTVAGSAAWGGWLLFVYALMQFVFGPIIGNLSDRFGRRPVLLGSIAAVAADYVLMGWAPTVGWLFLGRLIAGAAGATFTLTNAYVADISPAEERPANMALMGAAFGVGFVLGPAVGGLLGEYGTRIPFYGAAGFAALNFLWGLLVLPESLATEHRRPFQLQRSHLVAALGRMRAYPMVLGLIAAYFLYFLGHQSLPSVWSFFATEKFGWSPADIGASLAFVGVGQIVVSAWLIRVVIARLGPRLTTMLGYAFVTTALLGYAFSPTAWLLYVFLTAGALGGFTAAFSGILSNQVPPDAQGELQGALSSVVSVTSILGPLLMTQLFAYFASDAAPVYFPGMPFVAAAALTLAAWSVFAAVMARRTDEPPEPAPAPAAAAIED